MKNNKNIDRLFQEKFRNFEAEPGEQTWSNIQNALQQDKKEKRVVPLWFNYSGIAVAFLLGLFTFNSVFNTTSEPADTHKLKALPSNSEKAILAKSDSNLKKLKAKIVTNYYSQKETTREKLDSFSTKSHFKTVLKKSNNSNSIAVFNKEDSKALEKNKLAQEDEKSASLNVEKSVQNKTIVNTDVTILKNDDSVEKDKKSPKIVALNSEKKETASSENINELEDFLKDKESYKEKIAVATSNNKWELSPNVAAMYLNSSANTSVIDPQLSNNKKSGETGISYGIGINYKLNKNLVLRSGINTLTVGYNTNDVSFAAGLNTRSLANVKYTSNEAIEIQNKATFGTLNSVEKNLQKTITGSINQKWGYFEVPLELSYSVLNKKFAVNLIGGISTLFLKQNEIVLVSAESNFKLGEASNLNSVHFSTNFGLGFKYQFVKSFSFNFEPMLKYQINTYSSEAGNYKPLFIGLYSGINYQF